TAVALGLGGSGARPGTAGPGRSVRAPRDAAELTASLALLLVGLSAAGPGLSD
ncbi:MAG: hypothetical protein JWQ53_1244, partial [Klenkia sp.]|nr:hypothetical protein [Klenkia sp.]